MSGGRRGGERRQHTPTKRMHPRGHKRLLLTDRGRVLRSVLRPVHVNPHYTPEAQALGGGAAEATSRSGKPAQAGRTGTGVAADERSAARHVSPLPQGRGREALKKRKEVEASVPARIEELGFGCPHVETQLQKSVSDVWSRISSANALQKERSGSSERGPSSSQKSVDDTIGGAWGKTTNRESTSPVRRERIGRRPGVTRDRHPAVSTSPKAVRRSRDQGCNGHWILRRALTDRRHPGSLRGVRFHERASRVVLAKPCILRPVRTLSKEGRTATMQHTRRCVRREGERGFATGMSEVRSSAVSWEQNAHAHDSER